MSAAPVVLVVTSGERSRRKGRHGVIMAALCNRGGIIFLPFSFYLLYSFLPFFPRLISAAADWMSTILLHMAWP